MLDGLNMAISDSYMQSYLIFHVVSFKFRTLIKEKLHDVDITANSGSCQCELIGFSLSMNICAMTQQDLDN